MHKYETAYHKHMHVYINAEHDVTRTTLPYSHQSINQSEEWKMMKLRLFETFSHIHFDCKMFALI